MLGANSFFKKEKNSYNRLIISTKINSIFKFSLITGIVGILLRIYQRIFIEKIFIFDNLTEFRFSALNDFNEPSMIEVLSSIMYPFGLTALIFYIYFSDKIKINKNIIYLAGIMYPLESLALGGRITIIVFLSMIFFSLFIKNFHKQRLFFRKRYIFIVIFFLFIFSLYSTSIVQTRLSTMGFNLLSYIDFLEVQRQVSVSGSFYNFVDRENFSGLGLYLFIINEIMHYYLVGVIEFIKLFNYNTTYEYWMGAHQFNVYLKFFSFIGIENLPSYQETLNSHHHPGQYTSFIGPALIDFGRFSLVYFFILGMISRKIYLDAISNRLTGLMLYPIVATTIIFSPMINLLMAQNLYILNSFLFFLLLVKMRY
ncbi:hypothetical protein N9C34_00600 [Candidatus Marinimicrobia bacterium]|nr:hypothetical protein [Candidatus Neomarinimicrobiota bacterium]